MQVTETLSDGLKRGFSVVVPAADIDSRASKRLAELSRTLRLPGFRPGKVPATVVKQRYGTAVSAEVLEQSVSEATQQVLTDRGLRAATQPKIELVSADPARDLEFKVELELFPDIAMPDFSAIALTRLKAEPSEEQIGRAVADLATRQRELVAVEEPRPAVTGDFLTIDFTGKVDGTVFPGGTGTDMDVEVGGPGFIPGFTEQMEGLSPGDSRTIEVSFPEGYGVADLAGKPAAFDVTAKLLKRAVVPAADDELAKKIGFEGLDDLKVALTGRFQRELDQLARLRIKRQLLDALAGAATFAVPQAMVEAEFTQIWQRLEAERKEGRVDADDAGKDDETLRTEYRAIAERRVRLGLLLSEIGRVNGITVAPDEMTRAMRAEAARYPGQEKQVLEFFRKNPQASETLRGPIFEEKVVDFVLELARVTDSTVTAEELARDPDAPPDAPVAPDQVAAVPAIPEQPVPEQAVHEQAIVGQSAEEP
jgi:trigger factor